MINDVAVRTTCAVVAARKRLDLSATEPTMTQKGVNALFIVR